MSKIRICIRCGEPMLPSYPCPKCGCAHSEIVENRGSPKSGIPVWRKKAAELLREELSGPEVYWWLSFCDPDKPKGSQFLGVIVVKAHGITDALTKCNAMLINPGGEIQGTEISDYEEARNRLTPGVLNRLLSLKEMVDLGWEPFSKIGELNDEGLIAKVS